MTIEELLDKEEGFVPYAYQDTLGYWTIGYGTLIDKRRGGGISKDAATFMMREKLGEQREQIIKALPWFLRLNMARQIILQSMAYQMGVDGLLAFKKTLNAMKNEDWALAAKGMRASKWAEQTPGRAERHAKVIETGEL